MKINFILAFCLKIPCIWYPYWRCADLCGFFFSKMWGFSEFSSGNTGAVPNLVLQISCAWKTFPNALKSVGVSNYPLYQCDIHDHSLLCVFQSAWYCQIVVVLPYLSVGRVSIHPIICLVAPVAQVLTCQCTSVQIHPTSMSAVHVYHLPSLKSLGFHQPDAYHLVRTFLFYIC